MDKNSLEIAEELYDNFEEITGYKREEIFNEEGEFIQEISHKTFADLNVYCKNKYDIDLRYEQEILDELDLFFIHNVI